MLNLHEKAEFKGLNLHEKAIFKVIHDNEISRQDSEWSGGALGRAKWKMKSAQAPNEEWRNVKVEILENGSVQHAPCPWDSSSKQKMLGMTGLLLNSRFVVRANKERKNRRDPTSFSKEVRK